MPAHNRKKVSEYGGKGVEPSTIHAKPRALLAAEERRRLLMLTGTDNPEAPQDAEVFIGGPLKKHPVINRDKYRDGS